MILYLTAVPTIIKPPVPEIEVEINGTFTIYCEAVGVPTPLIVWRLNWGNIPTGDRVTVTSVDGRGTLTIRYARPEDAGAYTCEALNNRGSIFATPDALIIVRREWLGRLWWGGLSVFCVCVYVYACMCVCLCACVCVCKMCMLV